LIQDDGSGDSSGGMAVANSDGNPLIPRVDVSSLPGLSAQAAQGESATTTEVRSSMNPQEDVLDENLVIDLSDDDLEDFLSELDDPTDEEKGVNDRTNGGKPGK